MIFHSLAATFGCLNRAELDLEAGLNVIQAPNESGKSTWLAFLRAMLYGLPTRERGPLADKNRYAPWNGAAMQGRMEVSDGDNDLVLIRDTVQGGAPMGRFFAAYAGTATQIDGLTGQNAGEVLTGVPRSVFERSALIRQSELAIRQDAELEKRILSLVTSGEEDTSYAETRQTLRNALNRRRHNKTGLLPQAESEIAELRDQLARLRALQQQAQAHRTDLAEAEGALRGAEEKLALHERMDRIEAKRELFAARAELSESEQAAQALQSEIEQAHIPPAEQLMRIKFNAANLLTTQVSMNHVQTQAEEARKQTAEAQAAMEQSCFAPAEPEAAAEQVRSDAARYHALMTHAAPGVSLIALLAALTAAVSGGGAWYVQQNFMPTLSLPLAFGGAAALTAAVAALLCLLRRGSRKRAHAAARALMQPYGVNTPDEIDPLLIHYNNIYNDWMARREAEARVNASWQNFFQTYKRLSAEILEETAPFCPDIENVHQVSPLLEAGLRKWKQLQTLSSRAIQLRERCSVLEQRLNDTAPLTAEEEALRRPAEGREELTAQRQQSREACAQLRSALDRTAGEMSALGDFAELSARLEELENKRETAQAEYDALALALDALEEANTTLQNRFSPTLSRRAGEIFSELTGGQYREVLLDEALHASASGEDGIPRSAEVLSRGGADQLYLAVRLAICEQVLPADKPVPLILDDALVHFDEKRMAAALDWLCRAARERQILLFTCQNREAVYLQKSENVHIIALSENRWK